VFLSGCHFSVYSSVGWQAMIPPPCPKTCLLSFVFSFLLHPALFWMERAESFLSYVWFLPRASHSLWLQNIPLRHVHGSHFTNRRAPTVLFLSFLKKMPMSGSYNKNEPPLAVGVLFTVNSKYVFVLRLHNEPPTNNTWLLRHEQ
jgi:hypothetical protein